MGHGGALAMQSDQVTVVVGELHARAGAIDTSASCVRGAHRDVPGRPRVAQSSRANASWPQISAKKFGQRLPSRWRGHMIWLRTVMGTIPPSLDPRHFRMSRPARDRAKRQRRERTLRSKLRQN